MPRVVGHGEMQRLSFETGDHEWLSDLSTGLCRRRRWSDPLYESCETATGQYTCTVRVNHREYRSDSVHDTETMAREHAAMRAYLICRNFSVNDGMYPSGHKSEGTIIQGLPVAIGTGRHSRYHSSSSGGGSGGAGAGYSSGGSSPGSSDSGRDDRIRRSSRLSRSLGYGAGTRQK